MKTHDMIDRRSMVLAREIIRRIDMDPQHAGVEYAREVCRKWMTSHHEPVLAEWWTILCKSWPEIRGVLSDDSEYGRRLRQSSPFCGILTPRERWDLYRRFRDETV